MEQQVKKLNELDIYTEELDKKERNPLYLVLDNIRSAYNVGSCFRTGDSILIEEILLCGISAFPPNKKLEKTALGTADIVPWTYFKNTEDAILKLKEKNIPIFIVELTTKSKNIWEVEFPKPVALIFGHEVEGVNEKIFKYSDEFIHIPMFGVKRSLNVATAIGITLFETIRQWRN